ncbi:cystine/glutamate transporter-like isoform X3 [Manacus candei]|uniref:cystine/glutamate transporter-like isoform X3 n=1 Tax=Manacus candei TaxID=415023 RepID=UPI0022266DFC|nr:cystine/glutamate transporter-like isoform X3 [Manacus candei]
MGKDKKEEAIFLRQKITLLRAFSLLIGSMVGSGIFISPKGVLKNTGTVGFSLVVWFACGLLSMFGALCYAELGTRITKSGGHYIYILETLGPLPSFLFLWAEFFAIRPANSAVVALAFGRYMLEPFFAPCAAPVPAVKLVSLMGYYMVLTLNSWSVTWSARLQTALSVVKLLALALIIVPGMMLLAQGHTENFQDAFDRESLVLDTLPLAFYAGMFAYSGWFQASFVREELVRPERNIPLAVIISVITVIVGYMLTNVSYYTVLGTQDVLASPAVAVDSVCGFQGRTVASSLLHDPHSKAYTPSCCHVNVPFGHCHGVCWRYLPSNELLQLFPMALHRISHPGAHCPSPPSPGAAQPIQGSPLCSCLFYHHLPLHSGYVFLLRPCEHQHRMHRGFKWFSSLLCPNS